MSKGKHSRRTRVVAIGGGTGLSTMLRGLKRQNIDITAIVTVADNGGGSGVLRQELGMLPPGDVRNCIQALANTEPTLEALLGYRFTEGSLKGQSFGNLFLAALNGMCGSFETAVARMGEVLAITGRVLPVTTADVQLCASFTDGAVISGECEIADYKKGSDSRINRVWLSPLRPAALPGCLEDRRGRPHFAGPRQPLHQRHAQSAGRGHQRGHPPQPRPAALCDEFDDPGRRDRGLQRRRPCARSL